MTYYTTGQKGNRFLYDAVLAWRTEYRQEARRLGMTGKQYRRYLKKQRRITRKTSPLSTEVC